jgi:metal-dependent amidase/aminoacylase/carboxypeptidase family protein
VAALDGVGLEVSTGERVSTVARVPAGTTSNVIPEEAVLEGTVRAVSEATRAQARAGVERVAHHVAAGLFGPAKARLMGSPLMGAEDRSYALARVPGCMAFLGAAPPGVDQLAPNHSNRMVIDESATVAGVAMHVAAALAGPPS